MPCLHTCSSKMPLPMHAQSFAFHRVQIEESKQQGHVVAKYTESAIERRQKYRYFLHKSYINSCINFSAYVITLYSSAVAKQSSMSTHAFHAYFALIVSLSSQTSVGWSPVRAVLKVEH